jgi:luciferase family oxidoreductase group 1
MTVSLGALDLGRIDSGSSSVETLWGSTYLAPYLESLGYSRYWVAEHHEVDSAHGAPEILVAVLAGLTESIRVGCAGILLRYYKPLKVAEVFKLLEVFYPNRIDLGIVRGVASNPLTHEMLAGQNVQDDYVSKVMELHDILRGAVNTVVNPFDGGTPRTWVLGSSARSAEMAARCGAAFCLGLSSYEATDDPGTVIEVYRERFIASSHSSERCAIVAAAGVCAASEDAARDALGHGPHVHRPTVIGTPTTCRDVILETCGRFNVSEFVFMDLSRSLSRRSESYGLLADAIGLSSAKSATSYRNHIGSASCIDSPAACGPGCDTGGFCEEAIRPKPVGKRPA